MQNTLFDPAGFPTAVNLSPIQPQPSKCPLPFYLNESIQRTLNNHVGVHKADSITVKMYNNVLATLFCRDEEAAGVCRLGTS